MDSELKTPREWEKEMPDGLRIYDPDGWRSRFTCQGVTWEPRPFSDPITLAEFKARRLPSTLIGVGRGQ